MADIWFISDTHFGHKNIIKYENRPFHDTHHMDEVLIENWNKFVKPNDIIYHLGDVFFSGVERQKEIMDRLNGHKILRLGNHDKATVTKYQKLGFEEVHTKDILYMGANVLLSHYPLSDLTETFVLKDNGYKNLHGHVHSVIDGLDQDFYKCVSVELTNYSPVHIDEIRKWSMA